MYPQVSVVKDSERNPIMLFQAWAEGLYSIRGITFGSCLVNTLGPSHAQQHIAIIGLSRTGHNLSNGELKVYTLILRNALSALSFWFI